MARCAGIKADGARCKAEAMAEAAWCWNHDPSKAEARKHRASRGGKIGGKGMPLSELQETKRLLKGLAAGVLNKSVERADAIAANQLLNSYIRCISVELQVREQQDLIERLNSLEADLQEQKGSERWGTYRGV